MPWYCINEKEVILWNYTILRLMKQLLTGLLLNCCTLFCMWIYLNKQNISNLITTCLLYLFKKKRDSVCDKINNTNKKWEGKTYLYTHTK